MTFHEDTPNSYRIMDYKIIKTSEGHNPVTTTLKTTKIVRNN